MKEHCNNTSARRWSIIQNRWKTDSIIKPCPFFLAKSLTVSVSISSKCANYIHDHYNPHGDRRLIEHHNQLDVAFEKVDDCLGCDIQKARVGGEFTVNGQQNRRTKKHLYVSVVCDLFLGECSANHTLSASLLMLLYLLFS